MPKRTPQESFVNHVSTVRINYTNSSGSPPDTVVCVIGGGSEQPGLVYFATKSKVFVQVAGGIVSMLVNRICFDNITCILLLPNKSLIVVDEGANTIHEISKDNNMKCIIGREDHQGHLDGVGTEARTRAPHSVLYMRSRRVLFISDTMNHCIREFDLSSGGVRTLCGCPEQMGDTDGGPWSPVNTQFSAQFSRPKGMAWYDENTFIVADHGNNLIRKVHLDEGGNATVSSIQCIVMMPVSVAVDGDQNILLLCHKQHKILKVRRVPCQNHYTMSRATGIDSTLDTPGHQDGVCVSALLCEPFFIHIEDTTGCLFVCEGNAAFRNSSFSWYRKVELRLSPPRLNLEVDTTSMYMQDLLDGDQFTDVAISVKDHPDLTAHANIICSNAFFRGKILSMSGNVTRSASMPYNVTLIKFDIDVHQLRLLLSFIYTKQAPDLARATTSLSTSPLQMCRVADMMGEPVLYLECLKQFARSLNENNIEHLSRLAYHPVFEPLSGPINEVNAFYIRNQQLSKSVV